MKLWKAVQEYRNNSNVCEKYKYRKSFSNPPNMGCPPPPQLEVIKSFSNSDCNSIDMNANLAASSSDEVVGSDYESCNGYEEQHSNVV